MMTRRMLTLVLVVATMSAPLALALCHVECAGAASSRDEAAHHSCHGISEPAAVSMAAVPHMCGHDDESAAGERALRAATAPVALIPLPAWVAPSPAVERAVAVAVAHSPPRSPHLVSQLRV